MPASGSCVSLQPALPALVFVFGGRSVVVAHDQSLFSHATRSQLKAQFLPAGTLVVDSTLQCFEIRSVTVTGGRAPLAGWTAWLNRNVTISVRFEARDGIGLDDLRSRVIAALQDDPTGIWRGGDRSADDIADAVARAADVHALLRELASPRPS